MIFFRLNDNEPIHDIRVVRYEVYPKVLLPNNKPKEELRFFTRIFTDGEVVSVEEEKDRFITEFQVVNKIYDDVDVIKSNKVVLKDYSYVVIYTIEREKRVIDDREVNFDIPQAINIYLNNEKDKQALEYIKQTLDIVDKDTKKRYLDNFPNMIRKDKRDYLREMYKKDNNIYKLK